jgi:hypothetical protein
VTWGFPPAGTAKGEIARLAWAEQIPPQWQSPPTDISAKACPLVDDALKQEVAARAPESWGMFLGVCFFAQERLILIDSGGENGSCRASVEVSPPSCTP